MDYSSLAPTPKDEHIPLLSEPAQFKQNGQPSETKGKTNPFCPMTHWKSSRRKRPFSGLFAKDDVKRKKSQPGQSAH